jgi:hypothetical protein
MLTPLLPHVCFFHFSDTCNLGSNGSTKFLESLLTLIPFQRADPALVLECYERGDQFEALLMQTIFYNFISVEGQLERLPEVMIESKTYKKVMDGC